uniref:Uncharacterized protein n=1 Tax=Salix viminalis TaxID=40686 RepID=A0A6N2MEG0_SALVM
MQGKAMIQEKRIGCTSEQTQQDLFGSKGSTGIRSIFLDGCSRQYVILKRHHMSCGFFRPKDAMAEADERSSVLSTLFPFRWVIMSGRTSLQ